ncbi:hypothetical protein MKW94_000314 [Papaver nudicaule]|uniref:Wax synthase domain-containing protein n=1 Tax=Papaver nudicaule TaxID=74823 RepID=A0AA41UU47_PAPNU|nr:hypothetical protein [Papaver nudicaule]
MEGEIGRIIKVCFTILASLTYCYYISKNIPKGLFRLLSILPIISIFTYLPLSFSSGHLRGTTGLFISWLANFKLLLFSFGHGPLSSPLSLQFFVSISCLPIKIKEKASSASTSATAQVLLKPKSGLNYAIKALILALLLRLYVYQQYLHRYFMLFLYCEYMYFTLELLLAMGAALARLLHGLDIETQFNHPYLSTSLQDFWGKRWNLMITSILRSTVYEPARPICTRIFGKKWGLLSALFATFLVSGLMHELMFYYMSGGAMKPNWEVMWFFALHGICLALEIAVKKSLATEGWRLHPFVSGPLTLGFVVATSFWLFFPAYARLNAATMATVEIAAFVDFVKGSVGYINV